MTVSLPSRFDMLMPAGPVYAPGGVVGPSSSAAGLPFLPFFPPPLPPPLPPPPPPAALAAAFLAAFASRFSSALLRFLAGSAGAAASAAAAGAGALTAGAGASQRGSIGQPRFFASDCLSSCCCLRSDAFSEASVWSVALSSTVSFSAATAAAASFSMVTFSARSSAATEAGTPPLPAVRASARTNSASSCFCAASSSCWLIERRGAARSRGGGASALVSRRRCTRSGDARSPEPKCESPWRVRSRANGGVEMVLPRGWLLLGCTRSPPTNNLEVIVATCRTWPPIRCSSCPGWRRQALAAMPMMRCEGEKEWI